MFGIILKIITDMKNVLKNIFELNNFDTEPFNTFNDPYFTYIKEK